MLMYYVAVNFSAIYYPICMSFSWKKILTGSHIPRNVTVRF